jgi:hypothetical protein
MREPRAHHSESTHSTTCCNPNVQRICRRVVRRYDCNIALEFPLCNAMDYHTGLMCAPTATKFAQGVGVPVPHLQRDSLTPLACAARARACFCRIRTGARPTNPPTSDWAHPCHVCTGTCAGTARLLGSLSAGRFKTAAWLALPTRKSRRDVKPASSPPAKGAARACQCTGIIASLQLPIPTRPPPGSSPDPPGRPDGFASEQERLQHAPLATADSGQVNSPAPFPGSTKTQRPP